MRLRTLPSRRDQFVLLFASAIAAKQTYMDYTLAKKRAQTDKDQTRGDLRCLAGTVCGRMGAIGVAVLAGRCSVVGYPAVLGVHTDSSVDPTPPVLEAGLLLVGGGLQTLDGTVSGRV